MKKRNLILYSIMKFNGDEHIDANCIDIKEQYEKGVCTCPLFCMTLVPECNPVVDKVTGLCDSYKKYKAKLDAMGVPSGVLMQATIGHGWKLAQLFPYQRYVDYKGGTERNVVCPYDEGFRDYIRNVAKTIAECRPSAIMIDDDFRLLTREGAGCACPLHMKKFNEIAGTNFTREELFDAISKGDEKSKEYYDIFVRINHEPIKEVAQIIREEIDKVDPYIQGSYCCGGFNAIHDAEVAKILSGEKNPVVIRLNNGHYSTQGTRYYSYDSYRAARQAIKLRKYADYVLAETDTCPQNRYSTTAHALHSHFTCSLMEGVAGAKQWLTRTPYEPESGIAYRKILAKHRDFYEEIARIAPTLKWRGFTCYFPADPEVEFHYSPGDAWITHALEVLGLPVAFTDEVKNACVYNGENVKYLTHEEIIKLLSGKFIIAGDTAKTLIEMGYGEYLGVNVRKWEGPTAMGEKIYANGVRTGVQKNGLEIVPIADGVEALSMVVNSTYGAPVKDLYPGAVRYKNSLGGTVYTFSGTPAVMHNIMEGYSFLTYSRKQQLIQILKECGEDLVYFPGDEEIYLKVAEMTDGGYFVSIINECADPVEEIELVVNKKVKKVFKLNEKGERVKVKFTQNGDKITLKQSAVVLNPVILFIY
ncbi:MAG: hypothetical protein J6V66_01155 [Clostridia bacterium]|nr:hypothetical protein [Clostridia bacterium]